MQIWKQKCKLENIDGWYCVKNEESILSEKYM